ncbi:hypothetical protein VNO78_21556 [Psophocarpus tetragonolobus]|uniref:Uncharacterized protein n=1 Tax=Psophocarpus tetragonolobus TaxID=3891 RepID=A0AAN9SGS6_PSOTE
MCCSFASSSARYRRLARPEEGRLRGLVREFPILKASFASDQSDASKSGQGLRSGFNYSSYRKGGISGQDYGYSVIKRSLFQLFSLVGRGIPLFGFDARAEKEEDLEFPFIKTM